MKFFQIIIITILFISKIIASDKNEFLVTAPAGLILRTNPTLKSNKITTIPYGEVVLRTDNFLKKDSQPYEEFYENKMFIQYKYQGEVGWYKIKYQNYEGYAYAFFLITNNEKNSKFFLYNEKNNNVEIKRNFINQKTENNNIKKNNFYTSLSSK
ncbi:hypothetical protein LEP1GSC195_1433 [Leptospira wolbachii serovar Codice str. CDC]|uniref:SH3 domain protein n=1 Tax=Leptospira wolbachii serovar Codice str. CDC TaxID=1218599 RepID=R8ZXU1_9LEPT|nr:SH3 domain-containing protein [Leptospira wolbachii]EOQ94766.1 hypothetical protein LEP1GSC195_1433 [Leptospira wolbachii serovar Codice str. CDC]